MLSFLSYWDVALFVLINQKGQNFFFDWFMPFMTDLKNFIYVFPFLALWILWKEKQRGIMTLVFLGLTITITDQFSSFFLKEWVGRVRPCHVLENVRLVLTDCNTSYSFPSSHAVNIFAAMYFLSQPLKTFAFLFYLIASLVAYSRVYIGIHYPLDNILGAGIGILVAWPLWRLCDLAKKKIIARPRGPAPKNPSRQRGNVGAACADQERSPHSPSDAEIRCYMEELNSVKEGAGAVAKLIACGRSAIEPLRQFLLAGKPSVVYHSRRWAVEALAGLGAKDVILEYLRQKKDISDHAVRFGEEAVESAAARELIRWPSEEIFRTLLGIVRERCLPGVLEVLGEFKRSEAVPYLVKALEDDVCRRSAEDALRKIGLPAEADLLRAAITPRPSRDTETPSSLLRRRSASRLLAEIGISADQWPLLCLLLNEADAEMLVAAFRIAAAVGGAKDRALAVCRLMEVLESASWYVKIEIENALVDFFDNIKSIVEEEIARRNHASEGKSIVDPVLTTLLRVKRRAEKERLA